MTTIGDATSRVRNLFKAVKEDPFMTDRFLYSLIMKNAKALMYRDSLKQNLFKNSSLFQEIPCLELIDVDTVSACCTGIKTACKIKRSKDKLPLMTTLPNGPVIRAITTLDYSTKLIKTEPGVYVNMANTTNFRYNNNRYYWIVDSYLFIPNVEWEAVRIQAMFEGFVSNAACGEVNNFCMIEQDRELSIPEHLFTEIETLIRQEILTLNQLPSDGADDSKSTMR